MKRLVRMKERFKVMYSEYVPLINYLIILYGK